MTNVRGRMRLGAFLHATGHHIAAWRHLLAQADAGINFRHYAALADAADGFNIMPPWLPGGLDDFVELVIPELQRRNLFRTEYEAATLRGNLGLRRPANRFLANRQQAAAAE